MTYDDQWRDDPTFKRWVHQVLDDMKPKMEESAFVAQLIPDDEGEVKFWVELGACIMMNKPIVAIAFADREIPEKLRIIADEIVVIPEGVSVESSEELKAAFKRMADRLEEEEEIDGR
jgi:hypothetical protein